MRGARSVKCRIECCAETSKSNAPNLALCSAQTEDLMISSSILKHSIWQESTREYGSFPKRSVTGVIRELYVYCCCCKKKKKGAGGNMKDVTMTNVSTAS